jgi:signal transduction histidine kinase
MSPDADAPYNTPSETVVRGRGITEQLRDFDFSFIAHPAVALLYLVTTPLTITVVAGFTLEVVLWELLAAALVVVPVLAVFHRPRLGLTRKHVVTRMVTITALVIASQVAVRLLAPDFIFEAAPDSREPGPPGAVLASAIVALVLNHLFMWLLFMVLVAGSLNYRYARRTQKQLIHDITNTRMGGGTEAELAKKQRDSVGEISRRIDAIEAALAEGTGDHTAELAEAVRELRQEVVRPSLEQLNALLVAARSAPRVSESVTTRLSSVPWRWQGMFFSGSVGALLIGTASLLLLAPTAYYFWGNFIQFGLIVLAFFMSVPAALLLFLAAAISPLISPDAPGAGGWGLISLILALGAISFLQRFNRVRQVRAVESMSVASAQLALDQVRRAQDLKVVEERVNSVLHGSVQSTLLALELGLKSGDQSVTAHSRDALVHLREAIARLDEPTPAGSEDFERALENIISVWAGSLTVSVDQSPDAADALHEDPLAASAVVEVVKEGTQNAVKHSDTREVWVIIGREGSVVRVRVSHRSTGAPLTERNDGLGMRYLGAITRTLRLVDDGTTTTLYAEIPTSASSSVDFPAGRDPLA